MEYCLCKDHVLEIMHNKVYCLNALWSLRRVSHSVTEFYNKHYIEFISRFSVHFGCVQESCLFVV